MRNEIYELSFKTNINSENLRQVLTPIMEFGICYSSYEFALYLLGILAPKYTKRGMGLLD